MLGLMDIIHVITHIITHVITHMNIITIRIVHDNRLRNMHVPYAIL